MAKVYVLGSGFSAATGLPLEREILKKIFIDKKDSSDWCVLNKWLSENLFPREKEWYRSKTLGEILSRLDLIRYYQPLKNADYEAIGQYEKKLLLFYREELSQLPRPLAPFYINFASTLTGADTIITFNHDLLAENSLEAAGLKYSYNLSNDKPGSGLSLLKLHGSVNMYFCPLCKKISLDNSQCQVCNHPPEPLIIGPTFFKSYNLPMLRRLWFLALEALAAAGEITFIGYSLNQEDLLSFQLFDFARRMNSRARIVIVNGPRANVEIYQDIYGDGIINTKLKFESFAKKN